MSCELVTKLVLNLSPCPALYVFGSSFVTVPSNRHLCCEWVLQQTKFIMNTGPSSSRGTRRDQQFLAHIVCTFYPGIFYIHCTCNDGDKSSEEMYNQVFCSCWSCRQLLEKYQLGQIDEVWHIYNTLSSWEYVQTFMTCKHEAQGNFQPCP